MRGYLFLQLLIGLLVLEGKHVQVSPAAWGLLVPSVGAQDYLFTLMWHDLLGEK